MLDSIIKHGLFGHRLINLLKNILKVSLKWGERKKNKQWKGGIVLLFNPGVIVVTVIFSIWLLFTVK